MHFAPVAFTANRISVTNWYDFIDLSGYQLRWTIETDGRAVQQGVLDFPRIPAHQTQEIQLPIQPIAASQSEYFLKLEAITRQE